MSNKWKTYGSNIETNFNFCIISLSSSYANFGHRPLTERTRAVVTKPAVCGLGTAHMLMVNFKLCLRGDRSNLRLPQLILLYIYIFIYRNLKKVSAKRDTRILF